MKNCRPPAPLLAILLLMACLLPCQARFKALAAEGDITFAASVDAPRQKLRPGTQIPDGALIFTGSDGQGMLQYGTTFSIFEISVNSRYRITGNKIVPQ